MHDEERQFDSIPIPIHAGAIAARRCTKKHTNYGIRDGSLIGCRNVPGEADYR